jgi:hypothetical protein
MARGVIWRDRVRVKGTRLVESGVAVQRLVSKSSVNMIIVFVAMYGND